MVLPSSLPFSSSLKRPPPPPPSPLSLPLKVQTHPWPVDETLSGSRMRIPRLPRLTLLARSSLLVSVELLANAACWGGAAVVLTRDGTNLLGIGILAWVSRDAESMVREGKRGEREGRRKEGGRKAEAQPSFELSLFLSLIRICRRSIQSMNPW